MATTPQAASKRGKRKNPTELLQFDFDRLPLLLNSEQAAQVLGVSVPYLKQSRSDGRRKGRTPAPDFVYVDGKVRYHRETLKEWAANLEKRQAV